MNDLFPSAATPDGRLLDRQDTPERAGRTGGTLAQLGQSARRLAAASMSANTRRAYSSALGRWDAWRGPAAETDEALAAYLTALFNEKRAASSAGLVVAAVKARAKLGKQPSPVGPATGAVLAGFRREGRGRGRGQVAGLRWGQADAAALLAAASETVAGLRDAALIAVGSDALLRVSELVALAVADVDLDGGTVTIRHSKTDQEGRGVVLYLGGPTVERVRAWLAAAGVSDGRLFRRVGKGGRVGERLSSRAARSILARRARGVGLSGRVSGHSLRVGSAQSLASAGASLVEMQQAGRWQSAAMPGLYARHQLARRGAVAKLRYAEAAD